MVDFSSINSALKFLAENYGTFIAIAFVGVFVFLGLILIGLRGVIAWLFRIREIQTELQAIRQLLEKSTTTSSPPSDREGSKPKTQQSSPTESAVAKSAADASTAQQNTFPLSH